jgi:alkaline phosphatase D
MRKSLLTLTIVLCFASCATPKASHPLTPVIHVDHGPNSAQALKAHYVVLVSLDGFRWDYTKTDHAIHLQAIAKAGAWAPNGMYPAYPSLTFPNHLTLITGLYPEHHGIVANHFYDPARKERYDYTKPSGTDGSWYSGTPLWALAEQQGMRSACLFWPGSEAEIAGVRPTYYLKYDDKLDDEKRIAQVLAWLKLPEADRPHFITLYYSNVDHEGHRHGPDSKEVQAAVTHVDGLMGELSDKLKASGLPVDLIIVSDHGMAAKSGDWITLDQFADLSHFETTESQMYPKTGRDAQKAYQAFRRKKDKRFTVYRVKDMPAELHYNKNARIGDPVIILNGPYVIRFHDEKNGRAPNAGNHGYSPYLVPDMKASFFAQGPDIKAGVQVKPFDNVNIYPFIADLLGLTPPKTDGNLSVLEPIEAK